MGAIFAILGLALRLEYEKNGSRYNCYVYKSNIRAWLVRHSKDSTFKLKFSIGSLINGNSNSLFAIPKKLTSSQVQQFIATITENFRKNQEALKTRKINPGVPLSYNHVLQKAEKDFANHQYRTDILGLIKDKLDSPFNERRPYKERLVEGLPPYFADGNNVYYCKGVGTQPKGKDREVLFTALGFLDSLPGVDTTPYAGEAIEPSFK